MKYRWINKVNKRIKKGPSSSCVKFLGSSSRNRLVLKIIIIQPGHQDCFTLIGKGGLNRHFRNPGIAEKRIGLTHAKTFGWFDNVFEGPTKSDNGQIQWTINRKTKFKLHSHILLQVCLLCYICQLIFHHLKLLFFVISFVSIPSSHLKFKVTFGNVLFFSVICVMSGK